MPVLVIDASAVVAGLVDSGPDGRWAERMLTSGSIAAPHMLPAEVANVVRRAALAGKISADAATLAHADLLALRADLFPYEPFADRIWALRGHLTCYDAWYVALAEYLRCPLATLDGRLARAPGVKCPIQLPSSATIE